MDIFQEGHKLKCKRHREPILEDSRAQSRPRANPGGAQSAKETASQSSRTAERKEDPEPILEYSRVQRRPRANPRGQQSAKETASQSSITAKSKLETTSQFLTRNNEFLYYILFIYRRRLQW